MITSKLVTDGPQYSIQIRDWKTGNEVTPDDFSFKNTMNAKKIELGTSPMPMNCQKSFH